MKQLTYTTSDVCQLSLLDLAEMQETPESDQEMIMVPFGNQQVQIPVIVWRSHSYANGDTLPQSLECLAESILLDTTTCWYGPPIVLEPKDEWKRVFGYSFPGRERYRYRCVASGIIGLEVWGAYTYEMCYGDLTRKRNPYEREEDDF